MTEARQGVVSGVVMEEWVHDESEEVPFSVAAPHHSRHSQFPCPCPTSTPAVEGEPVIHCIMDFGVSGRPSSTCLTLTPTTAAAATCLVWGRRVWQAD